ncbi:histidine phosphatase family protein [Candidatus Gracilibacteria bacterium]|nr:histidine phosphatase family protein [Candidatus Gracilibacteria bacterium]
MKIYIVRHGESESDTKQRYDGDYDDHLTEQGKRDAQEVAVKLHGKGIEHVFCSARIRAVETGEIICASLEGCNPLSIEADLQEQDIYQAFKEIAINEPEEEYRRLGEFMVTQDNAVEGVESYADFKHRVTTAFQRLFSGPYQTIVIVTHGGPIRCLFRELFKMEGLKSIANGAIIELATQGQDLSFVRAAGGTFQPVG